MLASMMTALVGLLLVGLVLVVMGVKGRRIDDHPTCRACGFDLENIYAAGMTCPECGTVLHGAAAVRIGQRRRRPMFVIAGLLLLVLSLTPIGAVVVAAATGTDLNAYKPLKVLMWEVDRVEAKKASAIAVELCNRLTTGAVDPAQEQQILAYALDRQADLSRLWGKEWSDIVDRVRLNGRLSKKDEQRFLVQSVTPTLTARPRVTAGEVFPIGIGQVLRAGSDQGMASISLENASINGVKVSRPGGETENGLPLAVVVIMPNTPGFNMPGSTSVAALRSSKDVQPGPATIELDLLVYGEKWKSITGMLSVGVGTPKPTSPKVRRVKVSTQIEVLPPEVKSVERIAADEATTAALQRILRPANISVTRGFLSSSAQVELDLRGITVPIAFDVIVRSTRETDAAKKEAKIGTITSGTGEDDIFVEPTMFDASKRRIYFSGRVPLGPTVDLVFRPRPDLAARTLDVTRVYDGEVVVQGVPVKLE